MLFFKGKSAKKDRIKGQNAYKMIFLVANGTFDDFFGEKSAQFPYFGKIECFDLMNPLKDCNFVVNLTLIYN